ncbi:zinc finger BED domain-containing protein 4-like [Rhizophagus irregularis DAOM 181602=DAOM 197198]|nr:zinc finger BED domain-containing protein 4-like [Rhizophagus irregularis DAOM 181602=DAOM 197198]
MPISRLHYANIQNKTNLALVVHPKTKAKSSRKKRSWTWDYFEKVDIKEQASDKGEVLKRCKLTDAKGNKCGTLYINDGSTGNAINHLLNEHEILKEGKINKNQTTLPAVIQAHKHKESRQCELRQFLTDWIIEDLQLLYVVQSSSFWRLISKLDPAFIMPDEKGIKKVIYKAYKFTMPALIEKIKDDAKSVSITTDMWTARNGQEYISVTCSYIDTKFNLNEITLTVNYVRYPHTAQHVAESLEEVFNEWNLRDKVFTITTDNAANIKKAIASMSNIRWQGCSAHTLQLIVGKALVPVKALIMRVKRLIEFFMRPKQSERLEDIQKKYPNANLENDELLDEAEKETIDVKDTAKYLQLINDVSTRWNSSYLAWVHLLYLKGWIKILFNVLLCNMDLDSKKDAKRLKQIMITDDEWDLITDLTEIIKTVTTDLANNQDSDEEEDDAFENNDAEEGQDSTQNSKINEPINTFGLLDEVKSKLYKNIKKYYPTLFTESLIPSILDPRFKKLDFSPEAQKIETKRHLQELFNNEKVNYQNNQASSSTQSTTQSKSSKKRKTLMARLSKANVVVINEIEEYL